MGVINKVSHLIVDEYQDINPAQEALIQTIGQEYLFVVGDPRQTIFQRFARDYQGVCDIVLPENLRIGTHIVTLAN